MDTPIYIDTYFRVESGYDGGRMPEEKAGRFFDEVKRLFTETGFSIKENKYKDGCPEVYLGKTCLYCHPQSLSGPVLKEHMELIEKILAQGTTFRYLRTDTYGEILDLTEEEELAYYHKTHDMTIGGVFLDAFRTKRRNLYKSREQVLEIPAIPSTVFQRSVTDGKHRGNPHHASRTTQTFSAAWRTRASCSITADGMSWTRENTVNSRSSSKIRPPMTA